MDYSRSNWFGSLYNFVKGSSNNSGNKIILAGNGPLLVSVAYYVLKFGGKVDAIVDTSSKFEWIKSVISLIFNPKNFIQVFLGYQKLFFQEYQFTQNH